MATKHSLNGKIGALESWSRTPDRKKRTAPGHRASPTSVTYWINKLRADGEVAEADLDKAAEAAHRAYMLRLSRRSAEVRAARTAAKKNNAA